MKKILLALFSISVAGTSAFTTVSCIYDIEATRSVVFASDDWKDGAFRESIYNGAMSAEKDSGGVNWIVIDDNSTSAYLKAYRTFFAYNTSNIIAAGANEKQAVVMSSADFEDKKYILVDEQINDVEVGKHVTSIFYEVQKAAFIAGYLIGLYSNDEANSSKYGNKESITVSGWGGADYQGVNNYLSGLRQGMTYFNIKNQHNEGFIPLEFVLYSANQPGANYSGGWAPGANNATDRSIAQSLIKERKVDFILPVAASQTQTALKISQDDNSGNTFVLGVDSDQRTIYPNQTDLLFTSITKNSELTVSMALNAANNEDQTEWEQNFGGQTFEASASNDGVSVIFNETLEKYKSVLEKDGVYTASDNAQEHGKDNFNWTNNNHDSWKWKGIELEDSIYYGN